VRSSCGEGREGGAGQGEGEGVLSLLNLHHSLLMGENAQITATQPPSSGRRAAEASMCLWVLSSVGVRVPGLSQ